jgi:hypothetical protein
LLANLQQQNTLTILSSKKGSVTMPQYVLSVNMRDIFNRETRKEYRSLPNVADFTAARAGAVALIAELQSLSLCGVTRWTVGEEVAVNEVPADDSNVDAGVTFRVRKSDGRKDSMKVPSPLTTIFNADGTVNTANDDVLEYVAQFITGSGIWTISDGEQLTNAQAVIGGSLDR